MDDEITVISQQPQVVATGDVQASCYLLMCLFRYSETLKLSSTILQHHNGNSVLEIISFDHAYIVLGRSGEVSLDFVLPVDFRE